MLPKSRDFYVSTTALAITFTLARSAALMPFLAAITANYALNITTALWVQQKQISKDRAKQLSAFASAYVFANSFHAFTEPGKEWLESIENPNLSGLISHIGASKISQAFSLGTEPALALKTSGKFIEETISPKRDTKSTDITWPILQAAFCQFFAQLIKYYLSPTKLEFTLSSCWATRAAGGCAGYGLYTVLTHNTDLISQEGAYKLMAESALGGTKHIMTGLLGLATPGGFNNPAFIAGYSLINVTIELLRQTDTMKQIDKDFKEMVEKSRIPEVGNKKKIQ